MKNDQAAGFPSPYQQTYVPQRREKRQKECLFADTSLLANLSTGCQDQRTGLRSVTGEPPDAPPGHPKKFQKALLRGTAGALGPGGRGRQSCHTVLALTAVTRRLQCQLSGIPTGIPAGLPGWERVRLGHHRGPTAPEHQESRMLRHAPGCQGGPHFSNK